MDPDRCDHFVERIHPLARSLLCAAVAGGGTVQGDAFRAEWGETALAGPGKSMNAVITSGVKKGWWPNGITRPLTPTGPDRRGWSKTAAYHMLQKLLPLFRDALDRYDGGVGTASKP
ncbi:hypothetical protein AB0A98_22470 [Streptomyces chrestomyceticus]|uniref:hypothetical protein n=1 Tax=Streptomyces chrestomyceticus TaxID=68185 RepID=UPI0033CA9A6C